MNLSKLPNIIRRYLWLFVLAPVVASLTTAYVVSQEPPSYKATTRLLVGPSLDSPNLDLNSLRIGGQLTQTYAEMAQTRSFLEHVNSKLQQKSDIDSLNRIITTRQSIETRLLTIIVYHPDPNQAVAIAKAAADTFVEISPPKDNTTELLRAQMSREAQQLEQIVAKSEATIQQLEAELATLKSARVQRASNLDRQNLITRQLAEERTHWADALGALTNLYRMLLDPNTNQIEIVEPAGAVTPVNNDLPLKTVASGLAGLILAVIIALGLEFLDDTIRSPQDFSRVLRAPLLGKVEKHGRLAGSGLERVVAFADPRSRAANSYRTVVSKLLLSIGESIPHTFLLNSVGSSAGDDAATAVINLAVAFAQAGHRVVVVDADLHRPILTKLFNAESEIGLSDLLTDDRTELQLISIAGLPGVRILPAGMRSEAGLAAALNPSKVFKLVEELGREADIVLMAGAPVSSSAESLTLASQVNGVILVVRPGEARIKAVNEVIESLNALNVQLTGIIFDENSSAFISKRTGKLIDLPAQPRPIAARTGSLEEPAQADLVSKLTPEYVAAAVVAADNREPAEADQDYADMVQAADAGNLPTPSEEVEESRLAMETADSVSTADLADSLTPGQDRRDLEEAIELPQAQDLEPAAENTELSALEQAAREMTSWEEAAEASVPTEDREVAEVGAEPSALDRTEVEVPDSEETTVTATASEEVELTPEGVEQSAASQTGVEPTSLEEVAADHTQAAEIESTIPSDEEVTRLQAEPLETATATDLEGEAVTTEEMAELPAPDETAATAAQAQESAAATTSMDVDESQAPEALPSSMLFEKKLELALLDVNGEKPNNTDLNGSKPAARSNHKKRNRRSR